MQINVKKITIFAKFLYYVLRYSLCVIPYGNVPKTKEELLDRYTKYTNVLLDNPDIMGFCYTQLYDVEQEKKCKGGKYPKG